MIGIGLRQRFTLRDSNLEVLGQGSKSDDDDGQFLVGDIELSTQFAQFTLLESTAQRNGTQAQRMQGIDEVHRIESTVHIGLVHLVVEEGFLIGCNYYSLMDILLEASASTLPFQQLMTGFAFVDVGLPSLAIAGRWCELCQLQGLIDHLMTYLFRQK